MNAIRGPIGRTGGGCRPAPSRYRPSDEQVPPTSRTDVTRSIGIPLLPLASDIEPVREDPLCEPPAVLLPVLPALPVDPVEPVEPVEPAVLPPAVDPAPEADPVLEEPVLEEPVFPAPVLEEPPLDDPPARFCSVPLTSTRLPTSVEKFDALPVKRYVVPPLLMLELLPIEPLPVELLPVEPAPVEPAPDALPVAPPAVLPVALPVEPVVPVADPPDDEEPEPIDASVRM